MSITLTPTTELEAVNSMLSAVGEAPINTLEGLKIVDAEVALSTLREISREIQTKGWHFNRETGYPLSRTTDNRIQLPANTLQVDVDPRLYPHLDVVQRGTRLYDKTNHTYTFTTNLEVEIVFLLDFSELPEAARRYITIRASRIFQDRVQGDGTLHDFVRADEYQALADMKAMEDETGDYNMLSDSSSVARVLRR